MSDQPYRQPPPPPQQAWPQHYAQAPHYQAPQPSYAAPRLDPPRQKRGIGIFAAALLIGGTAGFGGAALHGELFQDASTGKIGADDVDTSELDPLNMVSVQSVASEALPYVVKIESTSSAGGVSGSGIVISDDGEILTNYHVAYEGIAGDIEIFFDDGTTAEAEVLGTVPAMDVALLKAEGVSDRPTATLGQSEDIKVGQAVVAVGAPYGLDGSVTAGIVSTLNRPVGLPGMEGEDTFMIYPALQTDAPINPGNSGGALVNLLGQVVGINSSNELARSQDSYSPADLGSIGIGYAIPIHIVEPILEDLRAGREPEHAWLGVIAGNARDARLPKGAVVRSLESGAPEELEEGDVVVALDGWQIRDDLALYTTPLLYRPGDEVELTVLRDGDEEKLTVTLGSTTSLLH